MTVLIYVDTNKQVGEPEHIKVFANFCCLKEWEIGFRSPSPTRRRWLHSSSWDRFHQKLAILAPTGLLSI